jgi:hypothetical protein
VTRHSNSNLFLGDDWRSYHSSLSQVNAILKSAKQQIESVSTEMENEDKFTQEVTAQMYLMEVMLLSMENELNAHLEGNYKEAVTKEITNNRQLTFNFNKRWESFRKTFI